MYKKYFIPILVLAGIVLNSCREMRHSASSVNDSSLKTSLPKAGRLINDRPSGKDWIDLIATLDDWNLEKQNWKLDNGILHGDYN